MKDCFFRLQIRVKVVGHVDHRVFQTGKADVFDLEGAYFMINFGDL